MASRIIADKNERLQFIMKTWQIVQHKKEHISRVNDLDDETISEVFVPDTDFSTLTEFCGSIKEGIARVQGGIRRIPVIIL